MEFRILGPLEVVDDAGRPIALRSGKERFLLALLLLRANEVTTADELIDELWSSSPPDTAKNTLQVHLSRLRRHLGAGAEDLLRTHPLGYVLRIAAEALDATKFEVLVARGRDALEGGDAKEATETLRAALSIWRGPPLPELRDASYARGEILRLEELRVSALESRIDADLRLGRHAELVGELESLVAEHSLHERFFEQLMLALYRCGRQVDALAVHANARQRLREELGIDPSPGLQRLETAILRQDPTLELRDASEGENRYRTSLKTVSVLAVELEAEADLAPEAFERMTTRAREDVVAAIEQHGGVAHRVAAGTLLGLFGAPVVHEDDALRAVRAAFDARRHVPDTLAFRAGICSGKALVTGAVVTGDPVSRAIRLQHGARPGVVLISESTRQLAWGSLVVSASFAHEGPAWEVVEADRYGQVGAGRSPFVGRARELAELGAALDTAEAQCAALLVTVVGEAGAGKSRLAREFAARIPPASAQVVLGRCPAYGESMTYWPLVEIVRAVAGDISPEAIAAAMGHDDLKISDTVSALLGGSDGPPAGRGESFAAVRALLSSLARLQPVVLVVEDLHWAEEAMLDLLEDIALNMSDAPLLIIGLARPELLAARPDWPRERLLPLEPLESADIRTLATHLTAGSSLSEGARMKVEGAAEGNPLFLEQMLALALERGESSNVTVPPAIDAILSARIDRLDTDERLVLEAGAVVGRDFRAAAVAALAPGCESLDDTLALLIGKGLVVATPSGYFRFSHALIRDSVYEAIPRAVRGRLHEQSAAMLVAESVDSPGSDELIGYHLERAYVLALEAGDADEAIARRAGHHLATAGRRAYARGDASAASALLERAHALVEPETPESFELALELAQALRETGAFARADGFLATAESGAARAGERAVAARAKVIRLRNELQASPERPLSEFARDADAVIAVLEELEDSAGLARAWYLRALVPWWSCQAAEAERALEQALTHAIRANDYRAEIQARGLFVGLAVYGPGPVPERTARWSKVLDVPPAQRPIEAQACRALASLSAMSGDFDAARAFAARDRRILEDLGLRVAAGLASEVYAEVETLAGDDDAAVAELRRGYDVIKDTDERDGRSTLAARMASALAAIGEADEALEFSEESARLAGAEDLYTQVVGRMGRARALSLLGRPVEGLEAARQAVALASPTDFLNLRAETLLTLAELEGVEKDRLRCRDQAEKLYAEKDNRAALALLRGESPIWALPRASVRQITL